MQCFLWLHSPVFVGPCRKPRRPVFSQRGSFGFGCGILVLILPVAGHGLPFNFNMRTLSGVFVS